MKKFELDLKWNKENYHFPRNNFLNLINLLISKKNIKTSVL